MKLLKDTIQRNKLYFYPYLFLLWISLMFLMIYGRDEIFLNINRHHTIWGDKLFPLITRLGEEIAIGVLLLILLFFSRRYFIICLGGYIITTLLTQSLKHLLPFNNYRPAKYFMDKTDLTLVEGVDLNHFHSFPSGHSSAAFLVFTLCALFYRNKFSALIFLPLATLVAFSRVYLNQHFVEDVAAGSFIGAVTALILYLNFLQKKSVLDQYRSIDLPFFKL